MSVHKPVTYRQLCFTGLLGISVLGISIAAWADGFSPSTLKEMRVLSQGARKKPILVAAQTTPAPAPVISVSPTPDQTKPLAKTKKQQAKEEKTKAKEAKKAEEAKAKEAKKAEAQKAKEAKKSGKKPEEKAAPKPKKIFVTGSVLNRYRLRATSGLRDHEMDTIVGININDPVIDHWSGSFQVGGKFDLNGGEHNALSGIYDTFSENEIPRIYYGYMDIRKYKPISHIRIGRQHIYEMEHFYFDGALFETMPIYGFTFTVFGGAPVHMYENKWGSDFGDWTAGGMVQWQPIVRLRFRFDYGYTKDDQAPYFGAAGSTQKDSYLSWSTWYDVNKAKTIFFASRITSFADQLRDAGAQIDFTFPKRRLVVRARVYRLLQGYDIRVIDWDAFHIAGTYQPYTEVFASATKELGDKFAVDVGFSKRILDEKQTVSAFNHGFDRGFMTVSSFGVPWKGLNLSITGDFYRGEDSSYQNNSFAASFSASQNLFKDRVVINGGSSYYLYRYNVTTQNESDDVRVYFGGIDVVLRKGLKLRTQYEFENNDYGHFQTATSTVKWDF